MLSGKNIYIKERRNVPNGRASKERNENWPLNLET